MTEESEMIFDHGGSDGSRDLEETLAEAAAGWIPGKNQDLSKTNISAEQAVLFPAFSTMIKTEPSFQSDGEGLSEFQQTCLEWATMIMRGQTSIEGKSREDIIRTLETFGNQSSKGDMIVGSISDLQDKDDDD